MSGAGLALVDLDDGSLLAMARSGSSEAYAALFSRYSYAAHRLARHLGQKEDSDDVVSEAFAQVLDLLGRGKGPETAFRAYLFTTVRHECARRAKARKRVVPTDDLQQIDTPVAFGNGNLDDFERSAIRSAYESLPARWRTVLWHLDVEGRKPHELGPLLDLSPNSVSALVYRARAGLREAYLQQHVKDEQPGDSRTCSEHRAKLSAFVRRTASARDQERVHTHLESCGDCMAIYLDLQEVNREVGLVSGTTVVLGAVGLSLASVGAHLSVLLKAVLAVLVPPAAAAAIASAAIISIPSGAPDPARFSLASVDTGSSDRGATEQSHTPAVEPRAEAPRSGTATSAATSPARPVVSQAQRPAAAAAPETAAPTVPAATRPAAKIPPAPTAAPGVPVPSVVPQVGVRIDTPTSPDGVAAPRLTANVGALELTVGGSDGLVSLSAAQ
ncbi:sigma-70 family RNA polymerase sigma factor [Aeromicrobium endophyticum]|uniref:sigma-70 family RNA polymerase sigma factor n=1 Tax=Aeromicrobium endophyticum TaxID=2292704 RepID=UPI00131442A4|nr:sigma-70 family RNA polymerase sigma factor [Aeromicrobium endophyticum]